jgi:ABC-type nitrate/sulfonate/bicarbonate transport system permease component
MVRRANIAGWLFVVLAAGLAEACVRVFKLEDTVAAPSATLRALAEELSSGTLSGELASTLESYVEGLAAATVVGVVLGLAIGSSRTLLDALSVVIEFLRPIPAVALIPVAILFFGLGMPMRRFVIAYAALWPILIGTLYGALGADRLLHDVARTSGATRLGTVVRVTLPASLPGIATGIRVSAAVALQVAITAEFFIGTDGIGAYMNHERLSFHLPQLYAAILLTGALGYAINRALRTTERRVVFWAGEARTEAR